MKTRMRKKYNVRWSSNPHANIDVMAISDHHAKQQIEKLERQLSLKSNTRTIREGNRVVE